jgi:hydroxyacylglutathione hydrolase
MFFRQVLHEDLGCASYVIADGGVAAVVDPKWQIEDYLAVADEQHFRIGHVLETHNHADHLSGRGRLAEATGATIHISRDAGVEYAHEPLADGDTLELRRTRIQTLATPGHRPEHVVFLVTDTTRSDEPSLLLSGDSLFVADVARPDLAVEPTEGARDLQGSLRRLLELPDFVEVWPGHIGGSLCGSADMSEKPTSTIGFERRFNRLLGIEDVDDFVQALTSAGTPQPPNFERIVELNRGPLIAGRPTPQALVATQARERLAAGAVLIDGRSELEYDAAHVPGSINVPMPYSAIGTRAAWVVGLDDEVVLLAASEADAHRLGDMLAAVGFARLGGYVAGGIAGWRAARLPTGSTAAIDIPTLAERVRAGSVALLDVREQDEWDEGHVEGSMHVPYYDLRDGIPEQLADTARERPLAVACSAGNRSSIAASLLARAGVDRIEHVVGGGVQTLRKHGVELTATDGRRRS